MTNNHMGQLDRGLQIVHDHARVARFNNVRAAIKLQFRDLDSFIHKDFINRHDIRYIRRITETRLGKSELFQLVEAIRRNGCIPMATPFDEESVEWCERWNLPIIKIASADSNDWLLIERIAASRKPVIVSVGGTSLKDLDDMVEFFEKRNIPLAINHCIAAYPHEDSECDLNQIDFLADRYPGHTIGYSSHEYTDWTTSVTIAYAKGARTFERHIDIETAGIEVAKYSSLPRQIDTWFKAFQRAKLFSGTSGHDRRNPMDKEIAYLDSYIRGVYARHDLIVGQLLTEEDVYLAIPLQRGQISTRELMLGKYGHKMTAACSKDNPITIDMLDTPYSTSGALKDLIYRRGL
jgi:sialic acid synthase SpsE